MIDVNEFREGCRRLGGTVKQLSNWEYSCNLPQQRIGIGLNINGLVQVMDRRFGANDVNIMRVDDVKALQDGLSIETEGRSHIDVRIGKKTSDISIETDVAGELSSSERSAYHKKVSEFGSARFTIPQDSIMRMPREKISGIDWELEQGTHDEPIILIADGQNMVKGTRGDFMRSNHQAEYHATKKPVTVSFRVGDELKRQGRDHQDYPYKPPVCVPVGDACFERLNLYKIAEEIKGERFLDKNNNILKERIGTVVNFRALQSTDPDFPGVIRIVDRDPVNYVIYPATMLGGD